LPKTRRTEKVVTKFKVATKTKKNLPNIPNSNDNLVGLGFRV
jgi:hypothetical protein